MIQAIMLIALGFLAASLIGVLLAPSLWTRASRLSRKRLEHSLPLTLPEIEAAQDQLKASYALRVRRLETALSSAKQKAAMQLVENSRLQMQIAALKDDIANLDLKLAERRNAATVLEQTITKRFPELETEIAHLKSQLQERSFELQDLASKLSRREEELAGAQRAASSHEEELARLRQALEKTSADRSGRRLRRASQWDLDDYRAEYDRLNLELSKMRQRLAQVQEHDSQQSWVIKEELQKLAELILASAKPANEVLPAYRLEPLGKRGAGQDNLRDRPLPWPEPVPVVAKTPQSSSFEEREQQPFDNSQTAPDRAGAKHSPVTDAGTASSSKKSEMAAERPSLSARSKLLHEAVPAKALLQALQLAPLQVPIPESSNGDAKNGIERSTPILPDKVPTEGLNEPAILSLSEAAKEKSEVALNSHSPAPLGVKEEENGFYSWTVSGAGEAAKGSSALPGSNLQAADRGGAAQNVTLLDRLRGIGEDTVEPGK